MTTQLNSDKNQHGYNIEAFLLKLRSIVFQEEANNDRAVENLYFTNIIYVQYRTL